MGIRMLYRVIQSGTARREVLCVRRRLAIVNAMYACHVMACPCLHSCRALNDVYERHEQLLFVCAEEIRKSFVAERIPLVDTG